MASTALVSGSSWALAGLGKGSQGHHHLDPTGVQKAVEKAVIEARVANAASYHRFRHSFATHLLNRGEVLRTI